MPTIATNLTITNDKQYKDAIKQISSNLSVLRSEMKAATAQYELNEDATDGLAAKNDVLDRTLQTLADQLDVQQQQWARLVEKYGEADMRTQGLARAINSTTAEMYKTQNAIKQNDQALEDYNQSAEDTEDRSGTLGGVIRDLADKFGVDLPGGIDDALGAFGEMDTGMLGFGTALAALGTQLADLVTDTMAWSSELKKQSDITGLSTDSLQRLETLAAATGVEYDVLLDVTNELAQKMYEAAEGNEEVADQFRDLRVPIKDARGELLDVEDVFWDLIYSLADMEEGARRDGLAMEIIGENARRLNPLLNLTSEEIDKVGDSVKKVSEESIDNMNEMENGMSLALNEIIRSMKAGLHELGDLLSGDSSNWDMSFSLAVQSGNVGRNAHGTDYWRGGLTWVGEHGPELVNLPAGASVTPAGQAGGDTFNFNIDASNIKELNDLVRIAENARMSQRMGYTGR